MIFVSMIELMREIGRRTAGARYAALVTSSTRDAVENELLDGGRPHTKATNSGVVVAPALLQPFGQFGQQDPAAAGHDGFAGGEPIQDLNVVVARKSLANQTRFKTASSLGRHEDDVATELPLPMQGAAGHNNGVGIDGNDNIRVAERVGLQQPAGGTLMGCVVQERVLDFGA